MRYESKSDIYNSSQSTPVGIEELESLQRIREQYDLPFIDKSVAVHTQTSRGDNLDDSSSRLLNERLPFVQPRRKFSGDSADVVQKWEGIVIEVGKETFSARLTTLVGEKGDQVAEIYLSELDDDDRVLIAPGAVFYWSIGYLNRRSGRLRISQIRMRRLPPLSNTDLNNITRKAAELEMLLNGSSIQ